MGSATRACACSVTVRIRDAGFADIGAVVAIERVSFSEPWSEGMFRAHLRGDINTFLVAHEGEAVIGFAIAHTVVDESELLNIAVDQYMRGRGVGAILLDAICGHCAMRGSASMTLDVRASNTVARALYASHEFVQVGLRRRYYHVPEEDALILRAKLPMSVGRLPISR
jgi:ribosomal-protein-alanine N-acetyltransferase